MEAQAGSRTPGTDAPYPDASAANLVHDVNNLLTIVLGSLEQLRRQQLDGRGREQLDRAQWGARQAGMIARQMLSAARGDARVATVDLNEIVGRFGRTLGDAAGEGVSLAVDLATGPLPARLDPDQLELALLNLVRNATDAMPGGGRVVLRTAGHPVDGLGNQPTVEVSVSDTGPGMAPGVAEQALNPFFTTKGPRGTGLGLWAVQRFAADSGGKAEIETAIGHGTRVRIVLPRAGKA